MNNSDYKFYWYSFSLTGVNQGVILIEADNINDADSKLEELNIIPNFDNIECVVIDNAEIELNRLYKKEELVAKGYISSNQHN